jgi:hypothetical protein
MRRPLSVSLNFAGFRPLLTNKPTIRRRLPEKAHVSAKASQRVSTRCLPVHFPRTETYLRKAIRVQSPDTTIELEESRPATPILPRKHFRFVIRRGEPIVQMAAPLGPLPGLPHHTGGRSAGPRSPPLVRAHQPHTGAVVPVVPAARVVRRARLPIGQKHS